MRQKKQFATMLIFLCQLKTHAMLTIGSNLKFSSSCKAQFEHIKTNQWDKDYEDLLNSVQRHTQCSTAYCLHKKSNESELLCRFNFPKECCDQTHLEYE